MKKYVLDLSPIIVDEKDYPLQENLSNMLRAPGMFKQAEDVVEAINLAKQIRDSNSEILEIDEREKGILKSVIDRHLELTHRGVAGFGGIIHEELIIRVVSIKEKTDD